MLNTILGQIIGNLSYKKNFVNLIFPIEDTKLFSWDSGLILIIIYHVKIFLSMKF